MSKLALAMCLATGLLVSAALAVEPLREAVADESWDAAFDRADGWIGGDAIYSTPLPGGDVLWLFADTFLGQVRERRRQPGVRMVNNTLARHAGVLGGAAPGHQSLRFLWGGAPEIENAKAWIVPDPALEPDGKPTDEWYWVADAIIASDAVSRDRLVVFLWRIARTSNEVFGFRGVGNALATIDAPADDWTKWRPKQTRITHAIPANSSEKKRDGELSWGSELALDHDQDGTFLLVYGYRQAGQGLNDLVLARAPAAAVENMNRWEFRGANGWSAKLGDAATLTTGLTTEFSVSRQDIEGQPIWVLIQSEAWFGTRILARTARTPYGPWSEARPVYQVPAVAPQKKHFTYAAKAHPECSRPGELLVSYVVNSFDFGEAATNADIYRPRFVRVPLSVLPATPAAAP